MKQFQVEQYGGKLHIMSDGWHIVGDEDRAKRELGKWLEQCTDID